jgi:hypothetical protein
MIKGKGGASPLRPSQLRSAALVLAYPQSGGKSGRWLHAPATPLDKGKIPETITITNKKFVRFV